MTVLLEYLYDDCSIRVSQSFLQIQVPPPIFNGDTTVTNDRARADVFNKYFYSVFTDEDCSDLSSLRTASKLSSIVESVTFTTQDVCQEWECINSGMEHWNSGILEWWNGIFLKFNIIFTSK